MRKFLFIFLSVLTFSLFSCGNGSTKSTSVKDSVDSVADSTVDSIATDSVDSVNLVH